MINTDFNNIAFAKLDHYKGYRLELHPVEQNIFQNSFGDS